MKFSRQCPKCGSRDILLFHNDGYPDSASYHGVMVGMTIFSNVSLHRYICANCGYTEEWVNQNTLEDLKKSPKAKRLGE